MTSISCISWRENRVLAIDPTTKGFGFVILEGPEKLIDWGLREAKENKNESSIRAIKLLIGLYRPSLIVLEDSEGKGSRRCLRVKKLIKEIGRTASIQNVKVRHISKRIILKVFAKWDATTKHQIACVIVSLFPELTPRLPKRRRSWMSEDERYAIFDAMAFALALFEQQLKGRKFVVANQI